MFSNDFEPEEEKAVAESEELKDEVQVTVIQKEDEPEQEVAEVKAKPRRRRSKEKESTIALEDIDRGLQPKEEKPEFSGRTLVIPESSVEFPEGTNIVGAPLVKRMLHNTAFRAHSIADKVAYLGRGPQKWFALELASWRVAPNGILYVPEQMADFSLLKSWKRLEDSEAPAGFVAFRKQ